MYFIQIQMQYHHKRVYNLKVDHLHHLNYNKPHKNIKYNYNYKNQIKVKVIVIVKVIINK